MFTTLLIIITLIYIAQMIFLRLGLGRSERAKRDEFAEPTVAVIVAARNEEERIESCLQSLVNIEYPKEKLEVAVVNDHSTDRTLDIMRTFACQHPSLLVLEAGPEQGNLRGKTNAVAFGIENTRGSILMFTDADCTVSPTWVRETVKYFDERIGIVGGFTILESTRMFEGIQSLDWVFLFGLASATAGWNIPLTAIGNNLAVRRDAYSSVGGYRKIPFSVTEDYSLVQAILQNSDYGIRFPIDPKAVVASKPCQNWNELFRQKQRWGVGGLDMVLRGMVIMAVGWLFRSMLFVGLFTADLPVVGVTAASICLMELQFLWKPLKKFRRTFLLKDFVLFEIYFSCYVLIIPFVAVFSRRILWKERKL